MDKHLEGFLKMTIELAMKLHQKGTITVCADGEPLITMRKDSPVDKRLPEYFQKVIENCREEVK
ncbi:hypothetical protein [Caloranaerobacter sp. DY30410]|uniref:hypothetical protein n=1 Tax=Caloranaerobacter sp. DY30410 TaxID=3238305 RepID=UPI003D089104